MELTVVMPCLNEAETVATCVRKAVKFIADNGISGEVVVADNGSTDGSQKLAEDAGARVVGISDKGYGNALMGGILAARGEYVIMGDADDSYDFSNLMPFVTELRNGADLVMGNRFKGGIAPGAMPPLHRYLGNPVLSFVGRLFFRSKIGDFHCGLRGFRRDSAIALAATSVSTSKVTEPIVSGPVATSAPMTRPAMPTTRPGKKNSQRGLNSNRNRRCRQPSRQLRRCGGRLRPSLASVVGTSVIFWFARVAFTTISLANSMPVAWRPSSIALSRRKPRRPQWKSPILLRKNRRPAKESTGLPR